MKRSIPFLLAAFAFCSASYAQTIYKQQLPDGRIVYSDKVQPRAKVQRELTDPNSELTVVPPVVTGLESQQADARVSGRLTQLDGLYRERNLAQADLDTAHQAKADGEEPMPGERAGTVSGRSRLNEAYWLRQDALARNLDRAQLRLERAEHALRQGGG
jgi:hypothetical protein